MGFPDSKPPRRSAMQSEMKKYQKLFFFLGNLGHEDTKYERPRNPSRRQPEESRATATQVPSISYLSQPLKLSGQSA